MARGRPPRRHRVGGGLISRPGAAGHEWIETTTGLVELVGRLAGEPAIGFDTEFHRERTYFPKVALVQLAWPDGIALVDAVAVDLAPLAPLLTSTTVVMHAAAQDLEVLAHSAGIVPTSLFDTQLAACFVGYGSPSLVSLISGELGIKVVKGDRLADWLRRPLPQGQLEYAAADVAHLLALYERLTEQLEAAGRLAWAQAECDELVRRTTAERDLDEAWWRIKEARQLRGKSIGVAQVLAAWRERRAAETDQPARFVLPDLALLSIAQRPPSSPEALAQVRGLDGRHLRRGGEAGILKAVAEGLALSRAQYRLPPAGDVDRELRPAVTLASAWLSQLGRDLGIDTALLGTRADIEALLRGDPDARMANGWRRGLVGTAIARLVVGEAALAFDGHGGLVLEDRSHRPFTPAPDATGGG